MGVVLTARWNVANATWSLLHAQSAGQGDSNAQSGQDGKSHSGARTWLSSYKIIRDECNSEAQNCFQNLRGCILKDILLKWQCSTWKGFQNPSHVTHSLRGGVVKPTFSVEKKSPKRSKKSVWEPNDNALQCLTLRWPRWGRPTSRAPASAPPCPPSPWSSSSSAAWRRRRRIWCASSSQWIIFSFMLFLVLVLVLYSV